MYHFFYIIFIFITSVYEVFPNSYLCDSWTNSLTFEKEYNFTANFENGTLNLRSSKALPKDIPKFSQLSISLPDYDLFLSPNGTIITASPINDKAFRIYTFFPNIDRRWFWFSECRIIK